MKVVELINRLEELGYNKDTEICFGFYNYDGEWYDFKVEKVEDEDRGVDVDNIAVILESNKEYDKSILQDANVDLEEDLRILIQKYC